MSRETDQKLADMASRLKLTRMRDNMESMLRTVTDAKMTPRETLEGSVRISVSGEVIPGAAQRGCPLYLRCSMPDLMR